MGLLIVQVLYNGPGVPKTETGTLRLCTFCLVMVLQLLLTAAQKPAGMHMCVVNTS